MIKAMLRNAIICTAFGLIVLLAVSADDARQPVDWKARIALVKPGMKRAEVEKILPPYVRPDTKLETWKIILMQGGSQGVLYWVDSEWRVGVCYDYTGSTTNAIASPDVCYDHTGSTTNAIASPDNRVVGEVTLTKIPCPPSPVFNLRPIPTKQPHESKPAR